jgi:AcrR family transcriptional regulator
VKRKNNKKPSTGPRDAAATDSNVVRTPRIRMAPQDRERFILENAKRFFAERGSAGQTRELARRLGITQSLLYRYFPSKEALVERVYEKWFTDYWNPEWESWITDRSTSLEQRLLRFYDDYTQLVYCAEWVRLFVFSALDGLDHHTRFVLRNRERLYSRIAAELRHEQGMPTLDQIPMTEFEIEQLWGMHATTFYIGQRRWLYHLPVPNDVCGIMAARVRAFMAAAPQQIATHLASLQAMKMASD